MAVPNGSALLREDFVGDTFHDFDEQRWFGQSGGAGDGSARRVGDELTVDLVEERPLPDISEEDDEGDDAFISGLSGFEGGLDMLEGGPILGLLVVAYDDAGEPGGSRAATEDLDGPDLQHAKEVFLEIVAVEPDAVGNCIRGLVPPISNDEVQETVAFIEGEGVRVGAAGAFRQPNPLREIYPHLALDAGVRSPSGAPSPQLRGGPVFWPSRLTALATSWTMGTMKPSQSTLANPHSLVGTHPSRSRDARALSTLQYKQGMSNLSCRLH